MSKYLPPKPRIIDDEEKIPDLILNAFNLYNDLRAQCVDCDNWDFYVDLLTLRVSTHREVGFCYLGRFYDFETMDLKQMTDYVIWWNEFGVSSHG